MHEGHRNRMFLKLNTADDALLDHETLEIFLFGVIPRKNTNLIAHSLLQTFGSLENVFSATYEQLMEVEGVGCATANHIKATGVIFSRMINGKKSIKAKFDSIGSIKQVVSERFKDCAVEKLEIYLLNKANQIIMIKTYCEDNRDKVVLDPQEFSSLIIKSKPQSVVLAHNHVSGNEKPSLKDNEMTKQCALMLSAHNVNLYDHIIYSEGKIYSYFLMGEMQKINEQYNIKNIIK